MSGAGQRAPIAPSKPTLLGGVESLLSAKVADGMTGRKHRYNMELVAQGIANIASAFFGGTSVTGTIARTATNIRAGARRNVAFYSASSWMKPAPRRSNTDYRPL